MSTPPLGSSVPPLARLHAVGAYPVLVLDERGIPLGMVNEWCRAWPKNRPASTRDTYLRRLVPLMRWQVTNGLRWNSPPEEVRANLLRYCEDELHLRRERDDLDGEQVRLTTATPVAPSTIRTTIAALKDFYTAMGKAGLDLYPYDNPLVSRVKDNLARRLARGVENVGAPDHAGIRSRERGGRRLPNAFIRVPEAYWEPDYARMTDAVCRGMHAVLEAMDADTQLAARDKAILLLARATGARIGEIIRLTVGGYRPSGRVGELLLTNKGANGRLVKRARYGESARVRAVLDRYLAEERPHWDPQSRRLDAVGDDESFFLTERGTPLTYAAFYARWRLVYPRHRHLAEIEGLGLTPHDIRHLYTTERMKALRRTYQGDALRARQDAFRTRMHWADPATLALYNHALDRVEELGDTVEYLDRLDRRRWVADDLADIDRIGDPARSPTAAPALGSAPVAAPSEPTPALEPSDRAWLVRAKDRYSRP